MTNQKYKSGDKVLVEAEFCDIDIMNGNYNLVIPHGLTRPCQEAVVSPTFIRPYTPKPEFEYGEVVEVADGGKWQEAIFKSYLPDPNVGCPFFAHVRGRCYPSWFSFCRKLQPKKELIEINGKKYDAEKVKERLADLKAEE